MENLCFNIIDNYEGYSLIPYDKTKDVINFSPGPTSLPRKVMEDLIKEINDSWKIGITPLEISHRSPEFLVVKENCEKLIKDLLKIPDTYSILWTHGGGHGQFSAVPLNLIQNNNDKPDYIVTGTWSNRSKIETDKFFTSNNICEFDDINKINKIDSKFILNNLSKDSAYIYLCSNETINGIEFKEDGIPIPSKKDTNNKIMIVDMSSDLFSKSLNWSNIDVAFACAPKNFGISGSTIVIVKNDLLSENYKSFYGDKIPSLLDWKLINKSNSFWNTLPVFNIYLTEKILNYYKKIGGVEEIEKQSIVKSTVIYNVLDNYKDFYQPFVIDKLSRSRMNIPFYVRNGCPEMTLKFLNEAFKNNIVGLRTKTPFKQEKESLRVSLYNAITVNDTIKLANFMINFRKFHL